VPRFRLTPHASRLTRPQLLRPLRQRPFRLLFAGQVVSDLGDWLDLLALLALIAYQWRLGAAALAALTMAQLLPWTLVGPFAGVLVDRWPRRRVMVACDLARAGVVLGLIWAPSLLPLLALVACKFVLSTFFSPARWATIQTTVPEGDLLSANSLGRLSVNATKMIGPVLGGLLVAAVGPRSAFVADSLTFLCSAALLARLPALAPVAVSDAPPKRDFWGEFRGGIACILRRRALLLAVGAIVVEMLIVESNDSLTVLAYKGVGMGEALVGVAIGCSGLGNVAGALLIGQWGGPAAGGRPFGIMGSGKLLVAATEIGIGLALVFGLRGGAVWLPLGVLAGAGFAAIWAPFGSILQQETPPELMGRVSAAATGLSTAFGLAGPPAGAALAERFGVGPVFVLTGSALALLGIAVLLLRPSAAEMRASGAEPALSRQDRLH
jgi:hypothetical protein